MVNPCPEAELLLLPTPFINIEAWRREEQKIAWTVDQLVQTSTSMHCGPMSVEFYNENDDQTDLDVSIFLDERDEPTNHLTILPAVSDSIKEGQYAILYRVFYDDYPDVIAEQT